MRKIRIIFFLSLSFIVFSCKKDDNSNDNALAKEVISNYAKIVFSNYEDAYLTAVELKNAINEFASNKTPQNFEKCKNAWLQARIPYGQSEAFRFYGGPIDGEDGPEGYLNAWPVDESFIDYVEGNPDAGIINNLIEYPEITKQIILDLNESISETSIFTGYHAIEFLLWGQDFNPTGPGQRSYADYLTGVGATAPNGDRRTTYLQIAADLLVEQLYGLMNEWKPTGGAYFRYFTTEIPIKEALTNIITSLGVLAKGELAGERMFVAIDTRDQENEHSCFSDNTIMDIKMNLLGISNVYYGQYIRVNSTSIKGKAIRDLIRLKSPETADLIDQAFADATAKVNLIPAPFDQTIVNNPESVLPAINALRLLSDNIVEGGFKIGVVL
jgi:putative iron-regulated protein